MLKLCPAHAIHDTIYKMQDGADFQAVIGSCQPKAELLLSCSTLSLEMSICCSMLLHAVPSGPDDGTPDGLNKAIDDWTKAVL